MATFSELIRERLTQLRAESGLVELPLYGGLDMDLKTAILAGGGQVGAYHFERWCSNRTCSHNSHDEGEASNTTYVPQTWVEEAKTASAIEWELSDDEEPVFLLPGGDTPRLVCTVRRDHWARYTVVRDLRPEATALLVRGTEVGWTRQPLTQVDEARAEQLAQGGCDGLHPLM